jgi:hypothetical protein
VRRRPPGEQDLARAAAVVVRRLRGWTRASWALPAARPRDGRSRADAVRDSVQRLADLAAAAEHRRRREVPHLADRVLPDALAVMANDISRTADPAATAAALSELADLRAALGLR